MSMKRLGDLLGTKLIERKVLDELKENFRLKFKEKVEKILSDEINNLVSEVTESFKTEITENANGYDVTREVVIKWVFGDEMTDFLKK